MSRDWTGEGRANESELGLEQRQQEPQEKRGLCRDVGMERVSLLDISEPSVPGTGNSLCIIVRNPRQNKGGNEIETACL